MFRVPDSVSLNTILPVVSNIDKTVGNVLITGKFTSIKELNGLGEMVIVCKEETCSDVSSVPVSGSSRIIIPLVSSET